MFSPPYPNSFDYTDVYNVELWILGYLKGKECNRALRASTLSSHVQISRDFSPAPNESPILKSTLEELIAQRSELWDRRIPEMVGGYFADLFTVLDQVFRVLTPGGSTWMVVGDSRYAGLQIASAEIIEEIAQARGWKLGGIEPFRSMRASSQQGGRRELERSPHYHVKGNLAARRKGGTKMFRFGVKEPAFQTNLQTIRHLADVFEALFTSVVLPHIEAA